MGEEIFMLYKNADGDLSNYDENASYPLRRVNAIVVAFLSDCRGPYLEV